MPYDAVTVNTNISHPLFTPAALVASVVNAPITGVDVYWGGLGTIVGTTKEKQMPNDLPVGRRVILHRQHDHVAIRETWSDADGNYQFQFLDTRVKYYVCSFDHTGDFRAVIADNLPATVI